jgi:hypothetical protein
VKRSLTMIPALALGLGGVAASLGPAGYASAASAAPTTVTIKAQGVELSGTVSSPKPQQCAKNRVVLLIKQVGTRGGGDDVKIGSDTAERSGGKYRWDTGNTGIEGRFYAKVKAIAGCQGATSKTVKAVRNP